MEAREIYGLSICQEPRLKYSWSHCGASYEVFPSVIGCWRSDDEREKVLIQTRVVVDGPSCCCFRTWRKAAEEGWLISMSRKIESDG